MHVSVQFGPRCMNYHTLTSKRWRIKRNLLPVHGFNARMHSLSLSQSLTLSSLGPLGGIRVGHAFRSGASGCGRTCTRLASVISRDRVTVPWVTFDIHTRTFPGARSKAAEAGGLKQKTVGRLAAPTRSHDRAAVAAGHNATVPVKMQRLSVADNTHTHTVVPT